MLLLVYLNLSYSSQHHSSVINARCMRMRVTVVRLSVTIVLHSKGFQLTDFAKKLSFPNYSSFFVLALPNSRPYAVPNTVHWSTRYITRACAQRHSFIKLDHLTTFT